MIHGILYKAVVHDILFMAGSWSSYYAVICGVFYRAEVRRVLHILRLVQGALCRTVINMILYMSLVQGVFYQGAGPQNSLKSVVHRVLFLIGLWSPIRLGFMEFSSGL